MSRGRSLGRDPFLFSCLLAEAAPAVSRVGLRLQPGRDAMDVVALPSSGQSAEQHGGPGSGSR